MRKYSLLITLITLLLALLVVGLSCSNAATENGNNSGDNTENNDTSGDNTEIEDSSIDTTAPAISDIFVTDITETNATITWTTNELATSNMEYGLTTSYGAYALVTADITADKTSHNIELSGLFSDTDYHYRVKSADADGNESISEDYLFTTRDNTAPVLSEIMVSGISDTTVTITWITDEPATSQIEYGGITAYGSITTLDLTLVTSHSISLSGLESDTTYHYRIKSADGSNNLSISSDYTFTTTKPIQEVGGVISIDTVWTSDFLYVVTRDLLIESSVTLTIEPGVIVKFDNEAEAGGYDQGRLELIVAGTLNAVGTSSEERDIIFTSNTSSPNKQDWAGIRFGIPGQSGGTGYIRNIIISYADCAIYAQCDAEVDVADVTLDNNRCGIEDLFWATNHGCHLIRLTAVNNDIGIFLHGINNFSCETSLYVTDCQVQNNGYGILINRIDQIVNISGCKISYNNVGIRIYDPMGGIAIIDNSEITNNFSDGVQFKETDVNTTGIVVTNCTISENTGNGLSLNRIKESTFDNIISRIERNTISLNGDSGIYLKDSQLLINRNIIIDNNNLALELASNIIYVESIDATSNWWGTTNNASIEQMIHDYYDDPVLAQVTYEPIANTPSDTAKAVISEITITNITDSGATISWDTDIVATSQVEYGETNEYGSTTILDETLITSHSVVLNSLAADTTYHFRVKSKNESGDLSVSSDYTFSTPKPTIEVSGSISADTTWASENVYIVTGILEVENGITLTIEPGTTVKFNHAGKLNVHGTLIAEGTSSDNILFTTTHSDPAPGRWTAIDLREDSSSDSIIAYSVIEYASTSIMVRQVTPAIHHNVIRFAFQYGVYLENTQSDITVSNNYISECGYGIYIGGGSNVIICQNTITDNTSNGISVDDSLHLGMVSITSNNIYANDNWGLWVGSGDNYDISNVNATNNWWGSTNETLISQYIYDYNDDSNLLEVVYSPYATTLIPEAP